MKFGNWKISDTGIEWTGSNQQFAIQKQQLLETTTVEGSKEKVYNAIVLVTDEEWLNEDDLYDFNFAFVYAAGTLGKGFDYETFDNTLDYQFETLDEEEE